MNTDIKKQAQRKDESCCSVAEEAQINFKETADLLQEILCVFDRELI